MYFILLTMESKARKAVVGVYTRKISAQNVLENMREEAVVCDRRGNAVISRSGPPGGTADWFLIEGPSPLARRQQGPSQVVQWAIPTPLEDVFEEIVYFTRQRLYDDPLDWIMAMHRYDAALRSVWRSLSRAPPLCGGGSLPKKRKRGDEPCIDDIQRALLGKYDGYLVRLSWNL